MGLSSQTLEPGCLGHLWALLLSNWVPLGTLLTLSVPGSSSLMQGGANSIYLEGYYKNHMS